MKYWIFGLILLLPMQPAMSAEPQNSQAENLVMPKELVTYASANGCSQITDFYDRPGQVYPPFVYGFLKGDSENSAVLWCANKPGSARPYALLIYVTSTDKTFSCPNKIEWWNRPKGLYLDRNTRLELSEFGYVSNPKKPGANGRQTDGDLIVDYYDGVSTYFYCYQGEWLYSMHD
ncbi:MAG: hypothetical protein ACREHG_02335 [Candidatus Saccharimonadales bacterium]